MPQRRSYRNVNGQRLSFRNRPNSGIPVFADHIKNRGRTRISSHLSHSPNPQFVNRQIGTQGEKFERALPALPCAATLPDRVPRHRPALLPARSPPERSRTVGGSVVSKLRQWLSSVAYTELATEKKNPLSLRSATWATDRVRLKYPAQQNCLFRERSL
jgi:hypothetical protein